ncbi:putative short-chain dehydrogenase/reductase family 42E member 2 [Lates japonicus]|uniref:Short-chain dehydrogenase/reductase family 42E member 2 n=1 Tax=Lates japonicus TaxID=270547 RepID=A0AAD3NAY1_LATJO|nr:putative short-chain dehydrogenase/reductase family 42E member 2 [Lates japonicus]
MSKQGFSIFTRRSEATDLGLDLHLIKQLRLPSTLHWDVRELLANHGELPNLFPVLSTTFISGEGLADRGGLPLPQHSFPSLLQQVRQGDGSLLKVIHGTSMELCGPNMSESGGSLCQVKQLPCHSVPLCRLQASGHHTHNHPLLTHQPWVNHPAPAVISSPPVAVRHRVNGATAAGCSSPECPASRLGEEAALARGVSAGKVVVTGGGGYFGFRLGRELARQGMSVILLDKNKPPCDVPDGAVFYQVWDSGEGPDYVLVCPFCKERSIPRLVYTSTINVVFAGKPIEDGDHIDHYSRTKAIAEQMVLSANGCSLKGGELLRTCVLRPCGIYGPEERRHLHRVMVNVERRLFSFRFGDPQARMNWVHVDNLVLAHTLAAEALTLKRSCVAAILAEYLHIVLRPVINVPLLFTRSEETLQCHTSRSTRLNEAKHVRGPSLADSVGPLPEVPTASPPLTSFQPLLTSQRPAPRSVAADGPVRRY